MSKHKPTEPEQPHHFFATNVIAWAVALTRRDAIASVLRESKGMLRADKNGGTYVYSVRVDLPKSAEYEIENYQPVDVPIRDRVHGSFKLLPKGRVVLFTPIED